MPLFIPKPEQQSTFFQSNLEPGEQVQGVFWCEQRLPLLMAILLEQGGAIAEMIFSKFRHRFFAAVTDRRVLFIGSTGWHDPVPAKFEAIPRQNVSCTQFRNWFGGHAAMDLQVTGETSVRRFRVPRSQMNQAQAAKGLQATTGGPSPAPTS